jgi:cell division protein FtsQ
MKDIIKNKTVKKAIYTLGLCGIAMLLMMSVHRKSQSRVAGFDVIIKPIKGDRDLISIKEVEQKCKKFLGFEVRDANIKDLNTSEIEAELRADKRIKKVEVFLDAHHRLKIWVIQRQPIIRILDSKEFSYYLDEEGYDVPVKRGTAVRVPLATGFIDLYARERIIGEKPTAIQNVYRCAKYIMEDEFLQKLIEQIEVTPEKDIVLIPKIGRQYIIIGDAQNLDKKFDNLKIMYKEGMQTVGWTKYKGINLKYDGVLYGIM